MGLEAEGRVSEWDAGDPSEDGGSLVVSSLGECVRGVFPGCGPQHSVRRGAEVGVPLLEDEEEADFDQREVGVDGG